MSAETRDPGAAENASFEETKEEATDVSKPGRTQQRSMTESPAPHVPGLQGGT